MTKQVEELEQLSKFLYDTVMEDDINYPARLIWIENVQDDPNADMYAARLLFLLTCSKQVKDLALSSLESFVNDDRFSVHFVVELGENGICDSIKHLGMGNKNLVELYTIFFDLDKYMQEHGHFPCKITELTEYKGLGNKIVALILYFVFGQIEVIPVDSHVQKSVICLGWVPEFCFS